MEVLQIEEVVKIKNIPILDFEFVKQKVSFLINQTILFFYELVKVSNLNTKRCTFKQTLFKDRLKQQINIHIVKAHQTSSH